jgi:undecaprenyl-diphosphatase
MLIGFAAALLALIFMRLGSEVMEGDTHTFDMRLLLAAQSLGVRYPWLSAVMRDLSGLGSTAVLTLFTVATVGYLALVSARITAALVATSVGLGTVLVSVFKAGFARPRPDAAYAELIASDLSFPSGHASMSAIVFLTVGVLIAISRASLAERIYILTAAALLTFLVGLSRVALGVHWATDVLGGWAFGAAWAIGWLLLAHQIGRRGYAKHMAATGNLPQAKP